MASPPSTSSRRVARTAAAAFDAAVALVLTLLLSSTIGIFFARRAVITLRIGDPGTLWQGPVPMILGAIGEITYLLPLTVWLTWMLNPLTGATIGQRVFRLRVIDAHGRPVDAGRRWTRTLLLTSGAWGWTLALLLGRWQVAVAATVAALVTLAGLLLALGRDGRALHDRLTGTQIA